MGNSKEERLIRKPRFLGILLALTLALSLCACNQSSDQPAVPDSRNAAGDIAAGAILHAWCWSFRTITESMEDIARAGYTAVQTSPINACYDGGGGLQLNGEGKWYYHYQPTDWTIGNYQLGTRDEFKAMCDAAHANGVKVIVDVVPNHTTPNLDSVSQSLFDAAGGRAALYHENGFNEIVQWNDRLECTTGQMGGLPDVNTENKGFQDYFIAYLNDCIACGADGFRYDTAKHIGLPDDPKDPASPENNFWARVTGEIDNADNIFNYGEVLQGDGERIEDYQSAVGGTTASAYGAAVREAVTSGVLDAESLTDLRIDVEHPVVVTWVESHDNYCNDGTYASLDKEQIIRAWAIICARGAGTPLFFDRPYGSTTGNQWGTMNRIGAAGDPFYQDPRVAAVNRFRSAMAGEDELLLNPDGESSVLLIKRGQRGIVVVNGGRYSYNLHALVTLPDGTYADRTGSGMEYTVSGGVLTGTILSGGIAVLYNDGYTEAAEAPAVSLETDTFIVADTAIPVTLHIEGADSGTYSIDGGEPVSYRDGDELLVGEGAQAGESVAVTLRAESGGAGTVMTYYFTVQGSRAVEAGTRIYFQKPESWGDGISAYVYDESTGSVREAAGWPGVLCALEPDGTYSYTFDEAWDNVLVIFTDGRNQIPGAMEPGMVVEADKVYTAN